MSHFKTFDEALDKANFERREVKNSEFSTQEDVFNAFREGNHVILKAPTGWGKTFAVAAAIGKGHAIYSLPLRVLANTISKAVSKYTEKSVVVQHGLNKGHSLLDPIPMDKNIHERYGLVFTTLDQTLSAFLGIPIGVKYRQGNILPAVVDSSHLIFDEFHLFDPARSMTTALFALEQSDQACIILTATLSEPMIKFLEETLTKGGRGVKTLVGERPFVNDKILRIGSGLEDVDQLDCSAPLTLIIRNRIQWAKNTATVLREKYKGEEVDVHLLHSELLPKDRTATEEKIVALFAEDGKRLSNNRRQILVSTQVVEAGVDITCDTLHTDWCPPASFIQRVGRSARYYGERSTIYWHRTPNEYSPYKSQKVDIDKLDALLAEQDGQLLSVDLEERIIQLSAESDLTIIENYRKRNALQETRRLRTSRNYEAYSDMIRSIDSVNVAIGVNPENIGNYLTISRSSFNGKRFQNARYTGFRYNTETKIMEAIETGKSEEVHKYIKLADVVLFDPEDMRYQPNLGLTVGERGGQDNFLSDEYKTNYDGFPGYYLEPYQAHVEFLYAQKQVFDWVFPKLEKELLKLGVSKGDEGVTAHALIDLVIWGHDIGKLDYAWQAAHNVDADGVPYEYKGFDFVKNKLNTLVPFPAPIAHSETHGTFDRKLGIKPPSHAWISSWSIKEMVYEMFGGDERLVIPVLWVIAEHHGYLRTFDGILNINRFTPYKLGYLEYLDKISQLPPWNKYGWESRHLKTAISKEEALEAHAWFEANPMLPEHAVNMYYLLSYVLRRCDWYATAEVSNPDARQKGRETQPVRPSQNSNIL